MVMPMNVKIDKNKLEEAMGFALGKISENMENFSDGFPAPSSEKLIYPKWENYEWTPGFWTGLLWLAYEVTDDQKYCECLKRLLPTFTERLDVNETLDTHDIGFIYTLSAYPAYQLFQNEEYKEVTIRAAKRLMERYNKTVGVIQAWGDSKNADQQGRIIIDSLLNMPLLYEVSDLTGDSLYRNAALSHAAQAEKYLVREDNSTYHTYYFDVLTGRPKFGKTAQGKNDESAWARGQAWSVYGFALNYRHSKKASFLQTAIRCADYCLDVLPEDLIPFWDLSIRSGEEPRDSSAAAILACGLLELAEYLPASEEKKYRYIQKAYDLTMALSEFYTTEGDDSNGILKHGTYSVPHKAGIDECCIWGDYFYTEALVRMLKVWNPYW